MLARTSHCEVLKCGDSKRLKQFFPIFLVKVFLSCSILIWCQCSALCGHCFEVVACIPGMSCFTPHAVIALMWFTCVLLTFPCVFKPSSVHPFTLLAFFLALLSLSPRFLDLVFKILGFAFWPTVRPDAMVLTQYLEVLTHHFTETLVLLCQF